MDLVNSNEFRALRRQLKILYGNKLAGRDYQIFLISRFDENDETIRPYLSTAYSDHFDPSLYRATLQQNAKGGGLRDADRQGGGHAEEKFIRSLNELAGMFGQPRLIEVYISRIPCGKRSSQWVAHEPFREVNMLWPEGCGPKLLIAMEVTSHILWKLWYEENYDNETAQSEALLNITLMNKLSNVVAKQWIPNI